MGFIKYGDKKPINTEHLLTLVPIKWQDTNRHGIRFAFKNSKIEPIWEFGHDEETRDLVVKYIEKQIKCHTITESELNEFRPVTSFEEL